MFNKMVVMAHQGLMFGDGWPFGGVVMAATSVPAVLATTNAIAIEQVKDMTTLLLWVIGSLVAVVGVLYARTHQQQNQMLQMLQDALTQVAKRDAKITELVRNSNKINEQGTAAISAFILESQAIRRLLYPKIGVQNGGEGNQ